MLANFIKGIITYFNALSFMLTNGLARYFIYTGIIGLALFGVSIGGLYNVAPLIGNFIISLIPWDINLDLGISNWLSFILSSVLFLSIFKYAMLICTAPLMSSLSAKVEYELTGEDYTSGSKLNILSELMRGLRINFRNLIRELFFTLVLLLLGLIPLFGIVSGILILLVQAYYAGFGNYDFWAERHFSYRETLRYMKTIKGHLCGNGIVYVFILAIPILGAFVAPPLATVAATMQGTKQLAYLDSE